MQIRTVLSNLFNLRRLIIITDDLYINGYQWKQIFSNYFPHIKVFRFRIGFLTSNNNNEKEEESD